MTPVTLWVAKLLLCFVPWAGLFGWRRWAETRPSRYFALAIPLFLTSLYGFVLLTIPFLPEGTLLLLFVARVLVGTAPFFALAFLRVYPLRPLILLVMGPALASIALLATREFFWPLIAIDALVLAIAAFDLTSVPGAAALSVERTSGRIASLSKDHLVRLVVSNHGTRPLEIVVRDDAPPELTAKPDEFTFELPPGTQAKESYAIRANRRGAYTLGAVHVSAKSRWGLWRRFFDYPGATAIHVYPDLQQLSKYAILARAARLNLMGLRTNRVIGKDNEFERLRDYSIDDSLKHVEWRATARRRKLTVKDFQRNQSQRLIFLLDCGRMMTNEAVGVSLLDHTLNSMLLLAHVALSKGDAVGLLCFSDEIHSYVPPASGPRHMNRLLRASFDRFPRLVESRYDLAFLYLATHCRKRSLVMLFSNVIDEVNALQVKRYLGACVGRHLPMGILLRDRRLFEAADAEDLEGENLYRAAAAADILGWRKQVLLDMESQGTLTLDVFPEDLTAPLVNRYLDIKAKHLL